MQYATGGIKLESLLKLNDVKVTAGQPGATPRRSGAGDSQPPPQQQGPAANGVPAGQGPHQEEAAALPVKTLLEFVAWVALEREAAARACAPSSGNREGAARCGGSRAAAGGQALALAVKSGFLAQQLPDLALAVRRMTTGGGGQEGQPALSTQR